MAKHKIINVYTKNYVTITINSVENKRSSIYVYKFIEKLNSVSQITNEIEIINVFDLTDILHILLSLLSQTRFILFQVSHNVVFCMKAGT